MAFDKREGAPPLSVQAEQQLADNPVGLDSDVREYLKRMHGEDKARRMIVAAANATGQAERIKVKYRP